MENHENQHAHGHDHGHHHAHGHHGHDHKEDSGFFYSLSNNDAAGGFVIIYTLIALACIIWLVTH